MTGFNLPPGCTYAMLDEAVGADAQCEVCKQATDDCICPECPICGEHGNSRCYGTRTEGEGFDYPHNLQFSIAQLKAQTLAQIAELENQISDAEYYLQWLEEQQLAEQYRKQTDQE
jgi:molybdopterin/thiamine biosynthesis adenylyltransferase